MCVCVFLSVCTFRCDFVLQEVDCDYSRMQQQQVETPTCTEGGQKALPGRSYKRKVSISSSSPPQQGHHQQPGEGNTNRKTSPSITQQQQQQQESAMDQYQPCSSSAGSDVPCDEQQQESELSSQQFTPLDPDKFKTELCRSYHVSGFCRYGPKYVN